jgi:hypothetical protein
MKDLQHRPFPACFSYGLLGFLCFLVTACAPRARLDLEYLEVVEEGVPVTISRGSIDPQRMAFGLREVLRLEQDPAIEESLLFRPSDFVMGSDGTFFVIDPMNGRIAVFGSDGRYRRSIGRKGAGPGEFDGMALIRFEDDVLTIWDSRNRRTTRYRTDGTLLQVIRIPERVPGGSSPPQASSYLPLSDGQYLTWHRLLEEHLGIAYLRWEVRIGRDGGAVPLVVTTGSAPVATQTTDSPRPGIINTTTVGMPFTGSPGIVLTPGNELLTSEGDTPELAWYDLEGRLLRRARLESGPRPFTRAMKEALRTEAEEEERSFAERQGRAPRPIREQPLPEMVGFSSGGASVDEFGYVWLRGEWGPGELEPLLSTSPGYPTAFNPWHVFGPDGRYLGVCRIPGFVASFMNKCALVITSDPDSGDMTPIVFRIVPVTGGRDYP